TKLDKIEVIRSGKDSLRVYEYGYSMLDVFARIRKSQPEKEINLGKGIYQGITDLLPELGPRALFILVSGNSLPEAFNQYSINRNIQYANSHSIPIYILALSENPETSEFYKDMARRTGGKYIIVPGSVEEKTLYDTVMSKKDTRYILSFKSGIKRDFAGRYIGLKFDVNYRGVMGKSEGGFFVPENQ
ncbi:MAG: 6-bladed beta-propeller, partial [Leptospira sp.]|nr:6-bladed beta-propeller [Leptospira sp.]